MPDALAGSGLAEVLPRAKPRRCRATTSPNGQSFALASCPDAGVGLVAASVWMVETSHFQRMRISDFPDAVQLPRRPPNHPGQPHREFPRINGLFAVGDPRLIEE